MHALFYHVDLLWFEFAPESVLAHEEQSLTSITIVIVHIIHIIIIGTANTDLLDDNINQLLPQFCHIGRLIPAIKFLTYPEIDLQATQPYLSIPIIS